MDIWDEGRKGVFIYRGDLALWFGYLQFVMGLEL
jgi:hypothetical protein